MNTSTAPTVMATKVHPWDQSGNRTLQRLGTLCQGLRDSSVTVASVKRDSLEACNCLLILEYHLKGSPSQDSHGASYQDLAFHRLESHVVLQFFMSFLGKPRFPEKWPSRPKYFGSRSLRIMRSRLWGLLLLRSRWRHCEILEDILEFERTLQEQQTATRIFDNSKVCHTWSPVRFLLWWAWEWLNQRSQHAKRSNQLLQDYLVSEFPVSRPAGIASIL